MSVYLDTSAAAKLLVDEAESAALGQYLDQLADQDIVLVSGLLLETELRRLAHRERLDQTQVSELLDRIELLEPDPAIYREAGLLPGPQLRSLDALHIAIAIRAEAAVVVTYDHRQANAAHTAGMRTRTPGTDDRDTPAAT